MQLNFICRKKIVCTANELRKWSIEICIWSFSTLAVSSNIKTDKFHLRFSTRYLLSARNPDFDMALNGAIITHRLNEMSYTNGKKVHTWWFNRQMKIYSWAWRILETLSIISTVLLWNLFVYKSNNRICTNIHIIGFNSFNCRIISFEACLIDIK